MDNGIPSLSTVTQSELFTKEVPAQHEGNKTIEAKSPTCTGHPIHHRAASISKESISKETVPRECPRLEEPGNLKLLMEPLPGQKTAFHQMQSPFKAGDITVNDPAFQRPSKVNKFLLAFALFFTSHTTLSEISLFNIPESDRSARVETIRGRVFTVTATLLFILTGTIILEGLKHLVRNARVHIDKLDMDSVPGFAVLLVTAMTLGVFGFGWLVSVGFSHMVASTVSACVDTYEKFTEVTNFTSPEASFLKKYQRMEESLGALRAKLYDAELVRALRSCETKESRLEAKERIRLEAGTLNPDPDKEKWYDAFQRYCLREWYEWYDDELFGYGELKEAIRRTEDWLNRAAKQKELLTYLELKELNNKPASENAIATAIATKVELKDENPAHWVRV